MYIDYNPRLSVSFVFVLLLQGGEEGEGRLKRRVHGSTDLTGTPKPSYYTVQREYAPLITFRQEEGLLLTCREDLPCYTVSGYLLRIGNQSVPIPTLRPGESWLYPCRKEQAFSIFRSNGDYVLSGESEAAVSPIP